MKIKLLFVRREYRKDIRDAVDEIVLDFPVLNDRVHIIHIWRLSPELRFSFASHKEVRVKKRVVSEIKLNPKAFMHPYIDNKFRTTAEANYESVKDVIWHELGHSLQIYKLCDYHGVSPENNQLESLASVLRDEESNIRCYKEHTNHFLSKFGWSTTTGKQRLGVYAINNPEEFIPECFNNYYRLRSKSKLSGAEQETFKFVKAVIEDYKNYIPQ